MRVDVWLSRAEEEQLYKQLAPRIDEANKALANNDKWTAFIIVHSRYNPTTPLWFRGPVEELERRLRDKFDETRGNPGEPVASCIARAREAALGIARHIASMALFTAESRVAAMNTEALQKTGTIFFRRTPPINPANALVYFKGNNAIQRMDAILCTELLAMLCAVMGYRPAQNQLEPTYHFKFEPYYEKFIERAPDRWSCAQLAAAARNFRGFAFDNLAGRLFKPIDENPTLPVARNSGKANDSRQAGSSHGRSRKAGSKSRKQLPVTNEPVADCESTPHFSIQSLQELAGERGGPEKYPAAMSLSWFAGRIKEFATVE